eukprot:COSAG01_NODE_66800_length_269_cov_0.552941_1_plen_48_part_10
MQAAPPLRAPLLALLLLLLLPSAVVRGGDPSSSWIAYARYDAGKIITA